MIASKYKHCSILLSGFALAALATSAMAQQVSREQDIVDLRLGQRVLVDDGSCSAGQIKEVSGARMTATRVCGCKNASRAWGRRKNRCNSSILRTGSPPSPARFGIGGTRPDF